MYRPVSSVCEKPLSVLESQNVADLWTPLTGFITPRDIREPSHRALLLVNPQSSSQSYWNADCYIPVAYGLLGDEHEMPIFACPHNSHPAIQKTISRQAETRIAHWCIVHIEPPCQDELVRSGLGG